MKSAEGGTGLGHADRGGVSSSLCCRAGQTLLTDTQTIVPWPRSLPCFAICVSVASFCLCTLGMQRRFQTLQAAWHVGSGSSTRKGLGFLNPSSADLKTPKAQAVLELLDPRYPTRMLQAPGLKPEASRRQLLRVGFSTLEASRRQSMAHTNRGGLRVEGLGFRV